MEKVNEKVDFLNNKYKNLDTIDCTVWQTQLLDENKNPIDNPTYHVLLREKEDFRTIEDGTILRKSSKNIDYLEELLELYFKYNYGQNSI